jgi:L-ascorbate metabolism protein UlaG (beta-lactamase superfamily)
MLTLTFHGHACFTLEAAGRRVIIDPFLTGNPATDIPLARLPKIDAVLLSHGHGDHLGDAIPIARRDGATIIAEFVQPRAVIPMHYNTWDVIKADPEQFKRQVGGRARVVVLAPGDAHTLS